VYCMTGFDCFRMTQEPLKTPASDMEHGEGSLLTTMAHLPHLTSPHLPQMFSYVLDAPEQDPLHPLLEHIDDDSLPSLVNSDGDNTADDDTDYTSDNSATPTYKASSTDDSLSGQDNLSDDPWITRAI
jgi:hypothetical protein